MKLNWKAWMPHLIAIGIFLAISLLYCKPALEGKAIEQHDLIQWKGMAQDAFHYKEKNGVFPLWTNGLFSGMPSYNIAFQSNAYVPDYIIKAMSLFLPEPFRYFFLACICFYFLSQVLRVNAWIGILGAIGFAFCSYDPIIIAVGHHTKMLTIALMPAMLGALLLLYEKKYWWGGALTAAFTAALIVNNHLQIIFYMMIVVVFVTIAYMVRWLKQGEIRHMIIAGSIALGAAMLGALTSSVNLFTTYDYSKESMRGGKANLAPADSAKAAAKASSGLDADYAFRWSYGKAETMSLLVPNINGGASESLGEDSKFYEALMGAFQSGQIDQQGAQQLSRFGVAYWGNQPFTSGPVYLGAIVVLLLVLGLCWRGNVHRWWALAAIVLSILMAWGSNFSSFNNFLFEYLPLYNKFRAPAMILVIPQLLAPMVGILGLQYLLDEKVSNAEKWKTTKLAGLVTAGLFAMVVLYYFTADFRSGAESDAIKQIAAASPQASEVAKAVLRAAGDDRRELFMNDLLRSLAFAGIGFGLLWALATNKLKGQLGVYGLVLLCAIDLLTVGRRYLNDDNFQEKDSTEPAGYLAMTNRPLFDALTSIQQDKEPHYRVFNVTGDAFNDALTSYFVRSVGGYHPAKLSIYQDLIEYQLSNSNPNMAVLNMLNTRYFVVPGAQGRPEVQRNPYAYGPAWFARHVQIVPNAAAEMKTIGSVSDLRDTAVVQAQYQPLLPPMSSADSTASITLTKYDNDEVEYSLQTKQAQLAVLSDVFYSRGWNAYADGKQVPIVKTNYVLRGVPVPAGTQKLVLKFEPASYRWGSTITTVTSIILLLWLLAGAYMQFVRKRTAA
jgi:hypothetical protein